MNTIFSILSLASIFVSTAADCQEKASPVSFSLPVIVTAEPEIEPAKPTSPTGVAVVPVDSIYKAYYGNGSQSQGWPSPHEWISFDLMFEANTAHMLASCSQYGVRQNSEAELEALRVKVTEIATATEVDARFILAIVLQESGGCVRVCTSANGNSNPGLMQSHDGEGTCNGNACLGPLMPHKIQDPCPETSIGQMIKDGVIGTTSGAGIAGILAAQGEGNESQWYRAARIYNGGHIDPSGDLERGCCTKSYASDIANRLTGWIERPRTDPAGLFGLVPSG